jgi:hypothetical protein
MKKVVVRILGLLLVVVATINFIGLVQPEVRDMVISLPAVICRYSLALAAGISLLMLRKVGVYITVIMVITNWIVFFTVYGGQSVLAPAWVSLAGPIIYATIFFYSWKELR